MNQRVFNVVPLAIAAALTCVPLMAQTDRSSRGFGIGYGSQGVPRPPESPQQAATPQINSQPAPPPQYRSPAPQAPARQTPAPQIPQAQNPQVAERSPQEYAEMEPNLPPRAPDYGSIQQAPSTTTQPPMSPDQLQQLVAPIALYPDALLAQILTASTYPEQVAVADQWLHQMQSEGYGRPEQVAQGADAQNWDPSVKALTAFPQVLDMLDQNLQWTTQLGDTYYNQPQDVMQTVQVMRQRAENAGTLQNTPQQTVTEDQGAIEVAPSDPENVYVPLNDPWNSYGDPVSPYPAFSALNAIGGFLVGGPVQDALGFAMSAFLNAPWGYLGWGLDWISHAVLFEHDDYFTHNASVADWGFARGGPRAYDGWARRDYGREPYGRGNYAREPYRGSYSRGNERTRGPYGGTERFARSGNWSSQSQPYGGYGAGRGNAYQRPPGSGQQAYGRMPQFTRPGGAYGGTYRAPQQNYPGGYASRSYASPSRSYAAPQHSFGQPGRSSGGGFHLFGGGGSSSRGFGGSAPRSSSGGGHSWFGGGHSSGGGRSFGGGGHSFGGGHFSGGGHSGGSHSSRGGRRR